MLLKELERDLVVDELEETDETTCTDSHRLYDLGKNYLQGNFQMYYLWRSV